MPTNNTNADIDRHILSTMKFISSNIYSDPESVLKPLRDLLKFSHKEELLPYIFSNLGFAYLKLGEYIQSEIFYSKSLEIDPNNIYSISNIGHTKYELGKIEECIQYGKLALKKYDESVSHLPGESGILLNGKNNIISFSLFGNQAKYCETAILNCLAAKKYYPDFLCRFYIDENVPAHVIERLKKNNAEIIHPHGNIKKLPGTFWRFSAMDDTNANFILIRDVDSLIGEKEAILVRAWINSNKPFHIIRDASSHTELILAGLFGVKAGIISNVIEKMCEFKKNQGELITHRYSDQIFLRNNIWPSIKTVALTYDRFFKYGAFLQNTSSSQDENYDERNHIGSNHAYMNLRFDLKSKEHNLSCIKFLLLDKLNNIVCSYRLPLKKDSHVEIILPTTYINNIKNNGWKVDFIKIYKHENHEEFNVPSLKPD